MKIYYNVLKTRRRNNISYMIYIIVYAVVYAVVYAIVYAVVIPNTIKLRTIASLNEPP